MKCFLLYNFLSVLEDSNKGDVYELWIKKEKNV
jgi:hypothetical protein